MDYEVTDALISPLGRLDVLSRMEVAKLLDASQGGLYTLLRNCSLAVLNCGSDMDDGKVLLERYHDFSIEVITQERGIKLALHGAPAEAFVDGKMIAGIAEHLFSVLRDVIYIGDQITNNPLFDLDTTGGVTDAVFHILRNAGVLRPGAEPSLVVCWGGHSIVRQEYEYTKSVGYEMGLRGLDVCTGCGPGAMKGPMKGATIGHSKQRIGDGKCIGLSEPGIIAAESPNPIVNELVILPDIEKRLEAFVRLGHGFVVFPGGAGTIEEILYLLGILLHPDNDGIPFPLVFTGPDSSVEYFAQVDQFIAATLGEKAQRRYQIVIGDPARVARIMRQGVDEIRAYRKQVADAFHFNWKLRITAPFQRPFEPTHENMASLQLDASLPTHELAANLRRAFSGVVAGNVKAVGILAIERFGHFEIRGDAAIMGPMDALLSSFVKEDRMKLPGSGYVPCYRIVQ